MPTLKDVTDLGSTINLMVQLRGASAQFMDEYGQRFRDIGIALKREHGFATDEDATGKITKDTALGVESEKLYLEFKAWWENMQKERKTRRR